MNDDSENRFEYRIISKDGTERTLVSNQPLITYDDKEVISMDDAIKESTLFTESQRKLKEREAALNTISEAIVSTDMNRNIVSINHGMEEMFGFSTEDIVGKPLSVLYENNNIPLQHKKKQTNEINGNSIANQDRYEVKYKRKNGKVFIGETLRKIINNSAGESIGCIGVITDISATKQIEQALEKSKVNLLDILLHSRDLSYKFNLETLEYDYVSPHAELVVGFTTDECINMDFDSAKDRFHEKDFIKYRNNYAELKSESNSHLADTIIEYRWRHKDGEFHWYNDNRTLIFNAQKKPIAIIGSVRDISEIKKSQYRMKEIHEQLQKKRELENIGILAGGLAHDFNNVLTGIFGNLSLVKTNLTDSHPGLKYLAKAENAMDRATRITGQLLTFSKGGTPVKKPEDLKQLIEDTTKLELIGFNVKPEFNFPDSEVIVHIAKSQIRQLIANVVINAAQSMPDGGIINISITEVKLTADAVVTLEPGDYIKIDIRDDGIGMDKKILSRVFDPYFSNKKQSSGLGLSTAYSILKKHDGHISIESESGTGTTVSIYLQALEPSKEKIVAAAPVQKNTEKNQKVLVMDDDEMILTLLTSMLKLKKYSVVTVKNGESAIEKYQASLKNGEPFDVVIMDLTIPVGMGGMEAVKELLQINPEVKCIVSSGYADDPIMANYSSYGFCGAICKPFVPDELTSLIKKTILI